MEGVWPGLNPEPSPKPYTPAGRQPPRSSHGLSAPPSASDAGLTWTSPQQAHDEETDLDQAHGEETDLDP